MSQALQSKRVSQKAAAPERARQAPAEARPITPETPLPLQTLLYLQKFAGNAAIAEVMEATRARELPKGGEAPKPAEASGAIPQSAEAPAPRNGSAVAPAIAAGESVLTLPVAAAGGPGPMIGGAIAGLGGTLGSLIGSPQAPAATNGKAPQAGPATGAHEVERPAADHGSAADAPAKAVDAPATAEAEGPAGVSAAVSPDTDPNFQAVKGRVHGAAAQSKQHAPAHAKVAEAHAAAVGPANQVASQAGAAQVDKMAAQPPGGFDKQAFMSAVRKAIDASAPKNLEEASDFKGSGKAGQVAGQITGLVGQNKQQAEGPIKGATEAPPDTSAAQPKPVTPLPAEQPGSPPAAVGAASAMPAPKSAEEVSLAKGPAEVNASMADAEVTEPQLRESNEPEFTGALDAKQTAEQHSAEAPQQFRQQEQQTLDKAKGSANASATQGLQAMHGDKAKALTAVAGGKGTAKGADEARRAEVSGKIETLYGSTKTEVTAILNGIDGQVDAAFKSGEEGARASFESYVDTRMTAYKDDRYSGLRGKYRWVRDKFAGLPGEVNQFYAAGRELYLSRMEGVIGNVADIVGRELTRAKQRIALGQSQIKEYVATLPTDLQKVGKEAEQNIQAKFDELTQQVDSKQDDLVNDLAKKYVESRDAVDSRIKDMKDANKGLIDKAKDAVMGVINTIRHLKDMLLNVLAKAVGVIGSIIAHPIAFLGNLVSGIKQGLTQFMSNIGEHLKKGLLSWLFGALGEAGLTLPEKFDLKGILSIIMQVLGLTYGHVRGLAVGIVGEEVVAHLEKTVTFFQVLIKEGPAGLWKWVVEKISEMKQGIMEQIKAFIQEKVIIAGIMWLIGLLNPVAAFIKACKAIYDIVRFFIDRAEQVGELVNAIVDSVGAIAGGALGEAAGKVEGALAKGIPVAIGFLAGLLGLGGISDKIKSIIHAIQEPIHNVISKVLGVVLKPFKWIGNKIKAGARWAKDKVKQGVAFAKAKAKQGVAFVKGKFGRGAAKETQPGSPADQVRRDALKEKAIAEVRERAAGAHDFGALDGVVASVFAKHQPAGLLSLAAHGSPENRSMVVSAEASAAREATVPTTIKVSPAEYHRMMGESAFLDHQTDPAKAFAATADSIGEAAGDLAVNSRKAAAKVKDPKLMREIASRSTKFKKFLHKGDWTSSGTLFHSIAKLYAQDLVGRSGGELPRGAKRISAEYTVRRGKGGSRLDLVIVDEAGNKHEIDWKTQGKSAVAAETDGGEFSKHNWQSAQHKNKEGEQTLDVLSSQSSRSWMDLVRPHLAEEIAELNAKVQEIEAKIKKAAASGKKLKLSNRDEETLRIAHAWADRGFFNKREVDEAFAMYFEAPVVGAAPGEEVKGAPGTPGPLSGKQVDEIMDASPFLKTFVEAKVQGGLKAEGHVHILDAPAYAAAYVRIMTAKYGNPATGKRFTEDEAKAREPRINGFQDGTEIYMHRDRAKATTTIHESMHLFQDTGFVRVVGKVGMEGTAEYFCRELCAEQKLSRSGFYEDELSSVRKLAAAAGREKLAAAFFQGSVTELVAAIDARGNGTFVKWCAFMKSQMFDKADDLLK